MHHRRNEILFFSLLATLVIAPLVADNEVGSTVIQIILGINIFAALIRASSRGLERALLGLVVALLMVRIGAGILDSHRVEGVALMVLAGVALLAAGRTVRFAMHGDVVDSEHVFAALSAYLLAGVFCGVLYWQLDQWTPGSLSASADGGGIHLQSAIYFSFMTLATVGFGDIVPRSDLARGLVTLEAVAGQLYVAVMIARLLTLYTGRRASDTRKGTSE